MNYTEKYELRWRLTEAWKVLGTYDTESEAIAAMKADIKCVPGTWRVFRISEVTVATVAKA